MKTIKEKEMAYIIRLNKCNLNCLFCMEKENLAKGELFSYKEVKEQISFAKTRGYQKIDFFGGEPTVFPYLKEAVIYAQKEGFSCTMATNCVKFSDSNYAQDFFKNIDLNRFMMRTSFHDFRAEKHDLITGVIGSHGMTMRGIQNILKHTHYLAVNIVITSLNHEYLLDIVELLHQNNVRGIKFSGLVPEGRILDNSWLVVDFSAYADLLLEAIVAARDKDFLNIEVEKMPKKYLEKVGIFKIKEVQFIDIF
ncbi:radical SAM protein [Candidatus Parcubacteria bacterium]|nr:radical SAM protein [Patescibacteria group bacterium]MBU4309576.1 radical SAM protein [Patescibacteria group bacterium]MBU4432261.1 radical SAM protein [Patescibacteria group bacterium]MBU4578036.1 radical SAM protein [Patescibacteria group bacterium]MCG2696456.1 radical SAM protein [Candidatus Parcubacteria bacterium]